MTRQTVLNMEGNGVREVACVVTSFKNGRVEVGNVVGVFCLKKCYCYYIFIRKKEGDKVSGKCVAILRLLIVRVIPYAPELNFLSKYATACNRYR